MHDEPSRGGSFIPNRVARTKARMQMAVALLPTTPELPWQTMTLFLDEMVPTTNSIEDDASIAFGVTVASDWQSLRWHVVDARNRLLGRMGENIQRAGAPASALLPLIQTSVALGVDRLGCWCRGAATGLTAGWFLPAIVPLAPVADLVSDHETSSRLWQWAYRNRVESCAHLAQSYLGAASHTALQLPLPGEVVMDQLANVLSLFEELGVEGIPDAVLAAIAAIVPATTQLELFVELNNRGLTQIGVVVPKPTLRLILHLHALAGLDRAQNHGSGNGRESDQNNSNGSDNDRLAAFQGVLGAAHMESVRCVQSARGFRLLYSYYPLVDDAQTE